jgi:hypothetical protein
MAYLSGKVQLLVLSDFHTLQPPAITTQLVESDYDEGNSSGVAGWITAK